MSSVVADTNCANCSEHFSITGTDAAFYYKMAVPQPTFCPICRMQRRLSSRNDRSLYRSECALTGKKIISMYDPGMGFTVYDHKSWWSDAWDPLSYGREFDFSRPFFEQFAELRQVVPRFNLFNRNSENCDYVNYAPHCKSCYLLFGSWFAQDCDYGQTLNECRDCIDTLFLDRSELCYQNIDCAENYSSFFCQNCTNAVDSYFCFDCRNVRNCIGCFNLRNKEYHIENRPVSKEEYQQLRSRFSSYSFISEYSEQDLIRRKENAIHRSMSGFNNQNVSGDFIFSSKNAKSCFSVYRSEDIAFCSRSFDQKDSYDFEGGGKSQLTYESMSNDFAYNSIVCTTCENLTDSHYCDLCFNCRDCMGCIGLRQAAYCILNKPYTKDEYDQLFPRIRQHMLKCGEWGEFFPIKMSPFAYNETMAQEYFPISRDQALAKGYRWKEDSGTPVAQTLEIPDDISEVDDSIVKEVLACASCSKNFKVIPRELDFYRKMSLPVPRKCPDCRHAERMALRNPRRLWTRSCHSCDGSIRTSYSPEGPEKVYCEDCYYRVVG